MLSAVGVTVDPADADAAVGAWELGVLERIAGGDRSALVELHERLGRLVRQRIGRITDDVLATELITIGVFAKVWHAPHEFAPNGLRCSLLLLADHQAARWTADALAVPG